MTGNVQEFIGSIRLGEAQTFEGITLWPLFAEQAGGTAYVTLGEALEQGFVRVTEVSEGGSVPELAVVNDGETHVLLLDGEELRGAKQNRMLNTTILLKPKSKTIIPVSCTEQGRWNYASAEFSDSGMVMAREIRAKKSASVSRNLSAGAGYASDQGEVWDEIAACSMRLDAPSPTSAMRDVYAAREGELDGYLQAFHLVDGQQGLLVALEGKVAGVDLLSLPQAFARLFPKLVKSYAMDALSRVARRKEAVPASKVVAQDFLAAAAKCIATAHPSRGAGEDVRLEGQDVVGSALVIEGCVIHLALFRREKRARDDGGSMASWEQRRRRHG
jgi:hypothetical protein